MILNDFIMLVPNAFMSVFLKTVRVKLDDLGKQEILKNGLYHITPNERVAEKIVQSQHFKPARGLIKNLNSYGKASVCFFDGIPNVENYMKNLLEGQSNNPYVHPTIAVSAVKVSPTKKEELANYKSRLLQDNAILYEGYCVLPENEIKSVYLIPDLVRNKETGEPIINEKTGKYDISFREAIEEELSEDRKSYYAKDDYLKFMAEEKERLGYIKGNNIISNTYNSLVSVLHVARIEGQMSRNNFILNFPKIIKRKIQQLTTPKLDMPTNEKIFNEITEFDTSKKNPYRDKKFGETVAEFQTQGLKQLELKTELEEITTSDIGEFFRQKYNQIDKNQIIQEGINGINHNNRVALLAMLIAKNEGLLKNDLNDKTKDILISAAYYQNIGRRKGIITDNLGSQSKKSAKKIGKMNLTYLDGKNYTDKDRKILQAIVEAHEGEDKDMARVCNKYKIDVEDIKYTTQLMSVIKDADALDRVRLDLSLPIAMQTDLNPKLLRLNSSKQLLNASYQLENLTQKFEFDRILSYKTEYQKEGGTLESRREQFLGHLKQGVEQMPKFIQKKQEDISKFTGKNITKKPENEIETER